jgi:organic hydroperoxide reductase OsmC/OhrA
MPAPFPHRYQVTVNLDDSASAEGTLVAAEAPAFRVGPPPQFDGRPGHHSPEDLLLSAIASCHMTTLVALARRKDLPIRGYWAHASGTLEKTRDGLRFTSIRLRVDASTDAGREAELRSVIEAAETHCIVSNALGLKVELEVATPAGNAGRS